MRLKLTVSIVILAALTGVLPSMGAELPTGSLLVSISLSPDKILVGLTTSIRIDVLNPTPKPLEMPNYLAMSGRYTPTGDQFIVRRLSEGETLQDTLPADYDNSRVIGAGKHQIFQIPVDESVVDPPFFSQPEFFRPGRYQVQLAFSTGFGQKLDRRSDFSGLQSEMPGALLSNVVDFTVVAPTGEDANVWQLILQKSKGLGWGGVSLSLSLEDDLWDNHPKSTYSMYFGAIVRHNASDERVAAIIVRLSSSGKPISPMLDWQLLDSASRHAGKVEVALSTKPRQIAVAIREADAARAEYDKVAKTTDNDIVRMRATSTVNPVPTKDQIIKYAQRLDVFDNPPPEQKVVPLAPCIVRDNDGTTYAQFGYENPNVWEMTRMPPGSPDNRFDPDPADRGQPEVFHSGKYPKAFKVLLKPGVTLTWTLNGLQVKVPSGNEKDKDQECSGNDDKQGDHG
jgi:hypothetical protein